MEINIIAAAGKENEIGFDNKMPWHMPADLKFFKETTMSAPIIMGRKTYESIGRILPGRTNVIISRNPEYQVEEAIYFTDFHESLKYFKDHNTPKVFVIGGGEIFKMAMPFVDYVYFTKIEDTFPQATVFFPELPDHFELEWSEEHAADEKNPYPFTFQKWRNTNKSA